MVQTTCSVPHDVVRTILDAVDSGMTMLAPELVAGVVERAARPDFARFEAQLRSSGYCARPVRLRGHIETCDANGRRRVWSTDDEPDGVLRKACGNRREAVCPSCAERYRQDAYHLIAAGLRGGKGVPNTAADHPAVFATLTAPSFGIVHTRALGPGGRAPPLPPATRRADLPARPAPVVRRDSRRGRSVPRRADLPGVLRPPGRDGVEQRAERAVAAHHDLPSARAGAPDRHHAQVPA